MFQDLVDAFASTIGPMLPRPSRAAQAARALSLAFTSARGELAKDYLCQGNTLDAYVSAFLLPGAAKALHCLLQLDALGLIPAEGPIDVLDLGAGPGTATLAASWYLSRARPGRRARFAAMDQSREALRRARELFDRIAPCEHAFEGTAQGVSAHALRSLLGTSRFHLVIAANLVNELEADASFALCEALVGSRLREQGALLLIDPALRETTLPLMRLRDRLLDAGLARVHAPCLHQRRCPMLAANERDWCHFYIDWKRPGYLEELDRLSGMDHRHLKMAYFVLTRESRVPSPLPVRKAGESRLWRVVSSPLVSKGKRELMLCGDNGDLLRMRRLERDASDENKDFDLAARGDVVCCEPKERLCCGCAFAVASSWMDVTRSRAALR